MSGFATTFLLQAALLASSANTNAMSYDKAYAAQQESGRPLLVLVSAEWCPACRDIKGGTIPSLQRAGKFEGVIFSAVDLDEQPELARQLLKGTTIPQLILFTKSGDGWSRAQLTGRQSFETVEAFLPRDGALIAKGESVPVSSSSK